MFAALHPTLIVLVRFNVSSIRLLTRNPDQYFYTHVQQLAVFLYDINWKKRVYADTPKRRFARSLGRFQVLLLHFPF